MFIDSNVFCYYFSGSLEHHEPVSEFLEQAVEQETLQTSVIVLMEVSHYLVNTLGPIEAKETVSSLLSYPIDVYDFNYSLFTDSVDQLARYSPKGIGGRDASILACMSEQDISTLITHDQAFKTVDEINVVDPVEQSFS
ncbi:MAG: type II toxin-antitoxin system VapC family toxin [bacterium]